MMDLLSSIRSFLGENIRADVRSRYTIRSARANTELRCEVLGEAGRDTRERRGSGRRGGSNRRSGRTRGLLLGEAFVDVFVYNPVLACLSVRGCSRLDAIFW
jgi:hypothetical protein